MLVILTLTYDEAKAIMAELPPPSAQHTDEYREAHRKLKQRMLDSNPLTKKPRG